MQKPHLLVMQSAAKLPATLARLHAYGFTQTNALAVSDITPAAYTLPPQTTALILTSSSAINQHTPKHLPVYAVGPATAAAATAQGLRVVYTGTSNAQALANTITKHPIQPQHFAHLTTPNAGTAWYKTLQNNGHTLTNLIAYTTQKTYVLADSFIQNIQAHPPTHALVFSKQGSLNLIKLFNQHALNLPPRIVAISPAVATVFGSQATSAPSPSLKSMLSLLA